MKLKNYCILVLGTQGSIKEEVLKISENKPRYVDATGMLLCSFQSQASTQTLENFFMSDDRSFFIFELDKELSGYHLDNEKLHKHLFGYLIGDDIEFSEKLHMIEKHVSAATTENIYKTKKKKSSVRDLSVEHLGNMNKTEREDLVNFIIDKGVNNMSESDKKLLKKISEMG